MVSSDGCTDRMISLLPCLILLWARAPFSDTVPCITMSRGKRCSFSCEATLSVITECVEHESSAARTVMALSPLITMAKTVKMKPLLKDTSFVVSVTSAVGSAELVIIFTVVDVLAGVLFLLVSSSLCSKV